MVLYQGIWGAWEKGKSLALEDIKSRELMPPSPPSHRPTHTHTHTHSLVGPLK